MLNYGQLYVFMLSLGISPSREQTKRLLGQESLNIISMVQGEGFEPPKAEPDDLQSPVFDRFTIPAYLLILPDPWSAIRSFSKEWSRWRDSNPRPAVYKTAALAN